MSVPTWGELARRLAFLAWQELRAVRRWYRHRRFATAQRKRLKSPATQPALFSPGEPGQIYIPRQLGVPMYIAAAAEAYRSATAERERLQVITDEAHVRAPMPVAQGQKLPPHPYNAETPGEVAYLEAFKRTSSQ